MTTDLFQTWICQWNKQLQCKDHKIILFVDNFSGHVPPTDLSNIRIEYFQPNLTSHIQPLDQGIIRTFKVYYCKALVEHTVKLYDNGTTPSDVYKLNQLEAMHMAQHTWHEVDTTTVSNCW